MVGVLTFSEKGQIVKVLDFAGHKVPVALAHLCPCSFVGWAEIFWGKE